MSLPIKRGFKTALEKIQETAKQAPNLYLKERRLDKGRKLKNMALAAEARECPAHSGKAKQLKSGMAALQWAFKGI